MNHPLHLLLAGLLSFGAASAADAAAPTVSPATPMIGWRNDGTGVFPGATPPAEFDGVTGKNLRWKTALPNHGSASPIVVGKQVFVVCSAGWPETQDCAQLLCFDADTGKELWRRDIDEFAAMPEPQAKEAREVRKEYHRRYRRLNSIMVEWQTADAAKKADLLKEAQGLGKVTQADFDKKNWGAQAGVETPLFADTTFAEKLARVCGYMKSRWTPLGDGPNGPTPVSDGKRVFVWTGRRSVHAFDLEGKILWQDWQAHQFVVKSGLSPRLGECDGWNSPLIVEGKLLMHNYGHLWAYDPDTGKLAWRTSESISHTHGVGTPTILQLKVPGAAGKTDAFAFLWTGDLVRIRDGKMLQKAVAFPRYCAMTTDGADILFVQPDTFFAGKGLQIDNGAKNGKKVETRALRFAYEGPDTVIWKDVWQIPDLKIHAYPIFHEGRLYCNHGAIVDSLTGKFLSDPSKAKALQDKDQPHGSIMAGDRFYGIPRAKGGNIGVVCDVKKNDQSVRCMVEKLEGDPKDPVKRAQRIAMAGRLDIEEWVGWHTPYSCPFAAGDRLYIRTFDHLYCFGGK